jgi:hypothetical protein
MGFYNYCLSLVLLWVILGYVVRRVTTMHAANAFILMLLFTAAYFTHLAGFLVALVGAPLAAILIAPRRPATLGLIVLAALPSVCLTLNYLDDTGFANSPAAMRVVHDPVNRLGGNLREAEIEKDLSAIENEVFGFQVGTAVSFGSHLGIYLLILTMLTIAIPPEKLPGTHAGPYRLFPAVFGILLLAVYVLVPDHLGGGQGGLPNGGFLKARMALLPPLFWIACLREPRLFALRMVLRLWIAIIVGANLWFVYGTVSEANQILSQYTAGIDAVGRGHRLAAAGGANWRSPFANPMTHALDFYCLGTGNVSVNNYEAMMPHFPIKFRDDSNRGRGNDDVDTVICWKTPAVAGWDEIFSQGSLRICRRPGRN